MKHLQIAVIALVAVLIVVGLAWSDSVASSPASVRWSHSVLLPLMLKQAEQGVAAGPDAQGEGNEQIEGSHTYTH